MKVIKRDGSGAPFEAGRIVNAIDKAFAAVEGKARKEASVRIAGFATEALRGKERVTVEEIQDLVIRHLRQEGYREVAAAYQQYRESRDLERIRRGELYKISSDVLLSADPDLLRENANLNGESFSGKMSRIGSEYSKWMARHFVLPPELANAVREGSIYVHDLDQYTLGTTNCIFIPFDRLLAKGFNTGNGSVRPPKSIMTAMALVAIIFQSQQNSQYGGVSANKIDWDLAPYVGQTFRRHFRKGAVYLGDAESSAGTTDWEDDELYIDNPRLKEKAPRIYRYAYEETLNEVKQAAESLIHNLNTMSSRAGGQIPFTSLNYGMCTSTEGRMVSHALLDATMNGLGRGETPIFPQHIFQCKRGVNQAEGEPNYDLFLKAVECSSRRLYPNFVNVDASFNLPYYKPEDPDTIIATMGCRTRTIADRFGRNRLSGKGNLSFNTVNLVKLGIEHGIVLQQRVKPDLEGFLSRLDDCISIAVAGLVHRFGIQAEQPAKASDFMMREGVWEGGEKLAPEDSVRELIKHGTLAVGFIGLAECLKALTGCHHGEDEAAFQLGLEIVRHMRRRCDEASETHNLNITLFATPAEGLSGKFTKLDRKQYGVIEGVTDREYYTNSFHIPVYYSLPAYRKIRLEAPFHELCNAGAISYVELDGSARLNTKAFLDIVRFALDADIGYFSVNHPIDRCLSCGGDRQLLPAVRDIRNGWALPAAAEGDGVFDRQLYRAFQFREAGGSQRPGEAPVNLIGYVPESISEGEGLRAVLFISGCRHACPGCFNPASWDFEAGAPFTEDVSARILWDIGSNPLIDGLTLCGGDPFFSPEECTAFVASFCSLCPDKTVWAYTGFTFEALMRHPERRELALLCDVIVDGRFVLELKDVSLPYRGSSNQRLIDVAETMRRGAITEYAL